MPNWCSTTIKFHGSKKEIEDFYNKIDSWTKQSFQENGFGDCWLGNILHGVGLGDRIDNEDVKRRIRCRGYISYLEEVECEDDEATFLLDMDSAWTPAIKMWLETIKVLKYETVKFSYVAEETGLGLYAIYDPFDDWPDRYRLDWYIEGEDLKNKDLVAFCDNGFFTEEKHIVRELQKFLKTDETDYKKLKEQIENYKFKDEDTYVYLFEFELLDTPDWGEL